MASPQPPAKERVPGNKPASKLLETLHRQADARQAAIDKAAELKGGK